MGVLPIKATVQNDPTFDVVAAALGQQRATVHEDERRRGGHAFDR